MYVVCAGGRRLKGTKRLQVSHSNSKLYCKLDSPGTDVQVCRCSPHTKLTFTVAVAVVGLLVIVCGRRLHLDSDLKLSTRMSKSISGKSVTRQVPRGMFDWHSEQLLKCRGPNTRWMVVSSKGILHLY